ncbi:MAG TPA: hypothetical protein EYP85_12225 [Armatimonadetes bacterium]|nr:hypothetical protein [Armatimonadota bacterium]
MLEGTITKMVWKYLQGEGWEIIGIHYPGATGGLYFHHYARNEKGARGAFIVDIVAKKEQFVLFIESKVRYDAKDIEKLETLTTDEAYRHSVVRALGVENDTPLVLLRGIAVEYIDLARVHLPPRFFVFVCRANRVEITGTYPQAEGQNIFARYRAGEACT